MKPAICVLPVLVCLAVAAAAATARPHAAPTVTVRGVAEGGFGAGVSAVAVVTRERITMSR